ncbi:exodeoxyribonuclease III [Sesbania bispinosa]|nr:exodeoxyribonuclease III [Sesbania bispinosa]
MFTSKPSNIASAPANINESFPPKIGGRCSHANHEHYYMPTSHNSQNPISALTAMRLVCSDLDFGLMKPNTNSVESFPPQTGEEIGCAIKHIYLHTVRT